MAGPASSKPPRRVVWRMPDETGSRTLADAPEASVRPIRDPDEPDRADAPPAEPGWQSSSYDLMRGLDVVELPTSLSPETIDRLFRSGKA
jgi:hypothetical protein